MPQMPDVPWDAQMPRDVTFGWGSRQKLPEVVARQASQVGLISGSRGLQSSGLIDRVLSDLRDAGLAADLIWTVTREPTVDDAIAATELLIEQFEKGQNNRRQTVADHHGDRQRQRVAVLAIGGGSAIDLAKGVAAASLQPSVAAIRALFDGQASTSKDLLDALPIIAVPTTAGTGAEATRNAVFTMSEPVVKRSLRGDRLMPTAVVIDPELTVSCPPGVTAASGMDAITQLVESALSHRSPEWCKRTAIGFLRGMVPALRTAFVQPTNQAAREQLAHGAFASGITLTNGGLGFAHGVAAALGAMFNVSHGSACAAMLPAALRINLPAAGPVASELIAALIGEHAFAGEQSNAATASIAATAETFVIELCHSLGLKTRLRDFGVLKSQLPVLAAASRGNSMSANLVPMKEAEILGELERRW